jgi:signal transduction histidine kinase
MKLRTKIILLTTTVAICVGLLVLISIRGVIVNAFRAELEKKAESIAGNLSERIADLILLKDYFQTDRALKEVLNKEKDLEYIFVTDEKGRIFAHTFKNGVPPDILSWNPLDNKLKNVQLLETEKGYIRDIGISIFNNTRSELHVGIREEGLKHTLTKITNITLFITVLVILLGIVASIFVSRLITKPLNKFIEFTEILGKGDFSKRLEIRSRDEIGYLAHSFNTLSMELSAAKKKMEEAYTYTHMLQAEKLSSIGQISAGLAHELKNPVTTLKMLFQAFKEQPDMTKEDAEVIYNEIEKIDNILSTFRGFVKQRELKSSDVDVEGLIDRVVSLASFELRGKGIVVHKDMLSSLPRIKGDRALLEQVFLNLLINSIEAMPNGGEIRISGKTDNDFVEVMIWDQGVGIPSKIKSKVFDPFFTTKAEGTGLGLFIAYNIVKSHGGKLYFNSSEKTGTVFTVRLPKSAGDG